MTRIIKLSFEYRLQNEERKNVNCSIDMTELHYLIMCLIVFFDLSINVEVLSIKLEKTDQNIGTVLFERSDCGKHCWTSEEFTILNSRRMFQDILPKVKTINSENDEYIALLMDYFHICLECVRKLSIGKTKHLMLKALADTMGGYLKVYVLPLTKHSYYAGNIKYKNAKRLFELFDELKNFLHTNGIGWLKPIADKSHVKTPPIVVTPPQNSDSCNGLITYPAPVDAQAQSDSNHMNYMKRKRYIQQHRRSARNSGGGPVTVPLPFLDDEVTPNSIAMPFKSESLQSLYCEKSAFAVVKYYAASVKCIVSKSNTKFELLKFNKGMFDWLKVSINPHLDDEKWYPAFGGILRVISSLKETGLGNGGEIIQQGGDYQVMPKLEDPTKTPEDDGGPPLYKGKLREPEDAGNGVTLGTTELVVIALAGALLVWLLVGLILVCYRFLTRNSDDCQPCESPSNTPVAVLYENTEYCVPECPSKTLRKGLGQRLKEWWKRKFGPCEGGCDNEDEERCLAAISYSSKDTIDVTNSSKSCNKKYYDHSFKSPSQSATPRGCTSSRSKSGYTSDSTSNSETERTKSR